MAYARTRKGAQLRVKVKRELRRLGVKGWKNDDPTYKLKDLLRRAKRKR